LSRRRCAEFGTVDVAQEGIADFEVSQLTETHRAADIVDLLLVLSGRYCRHVGVALWQRVHLQRAAIVQGQTDAFAIVQANPFQRWVMAVVRTMTIVDEFIELSAHEGERNNLWLRDVVNRSGSEHGCGWRGYSGKWPALMHARMLVVVLV
jgi:hypothetical protein